MQTFLVSLCGVRVVHVRVEPLLHLAHGCVGETLLCTRHKVAWRLCGRCNGGGRRMSTTHNAACFGRETCAVLCEALLDVLGERRGCCGLHRRQQRWQQRVRRPLRGPRQPRHLHQRLWHNRHKGLAAVTLLLDLLLLLLLLLVFHVHDAQMKARHLVQCALQARVHRLGLLHTLCQCPHCRLQLLHTRLQHLLFSAPSHRSRTVTLAPSRIAAATCQKICTFFPPVISSPFCFLLFSLFFLIPFSFHVLYHHHHNNCYLPSSPPHVASLLFFISIL